MRSETLSALNSQGFHRLHYVEWGSADNDRVLVCVHGLARNSRDFDDLARALSRNYRVVCPDVVGRGDSDWLPDPGGYQITQYLNDMTVLLARLQVDKVDWIGTSMGGLIGICLAALPNTPIRSLVLNDIGPFVDRAALQRIQGYLGEKRFTDLDLAEAWLRQTYPALRNLSDKQWRRLAQAGTREQPDGSLTQHYDPGIAEALRQSSDADVDLWSLWQRIRCPRMLIWGEASDVLQAETVERMRRETPDLELLSLPGIEHAPSLMESDQIDAIQNWLRSQGHL
ncbi:alpha/beta hydrolase [Marinobacterium nitratireducens]|uniref:Alpha/beta hydrolase n=1 Tax=Marinobacterium nitratireducens TaxID=518897 RepID=A0A917ZM45_9GAMM|nr:alpha/beta hydrolase [Marinobacterium nitratireducens]GGO86833.1 alpha/beta hydrolase [Marinobacterium nitratireducens]